MLIRRNPLYRGEDVQFVWTEGINIPVGKRWVKISEGTLNILVIARKPASHKGIATAAPFQA